jgi:multidrug efflux system outer membrane protein
LIVDDQYVLRELQEADDAFKAYGAIGSALELCLLESTANREVARLARALLSVLEAERSDFASRRALAVACTNQRLAFVSIYKALGGGWENCAQADQDRSGDDRISNLRVMK